MGSVEEFFTFMLPILEAAVHLLEIYADTTEVVGVILDLFSLVTENYIVFLNQVRKSVPVHAAVYYISEV